MIKEIVAILVLITLVLTAGCIDTSCEGDSLIINPFPADGATGVPIDGSPMRVDVQDDGSFWVELWSDSSGNWIKYASIHEPPPGGVSVIFMVDVDENGEWNYLDLSAYSYTGGWQESGTLGFYFDAPMTQTFGMTEPNTLYNWEIRVKDEDGCWTTELFSFTTEDV